jgi:hypothetical protein
MGAVIFDTETTGTAQPKLIEAAGIIFDHGTEALDLRPTVHFHERFNPGEPSSFGRSPPTTFSTRRLGARPPRPSTCPGGSSGPRTSSI